MGNFNQIKELYKNILTINLQISECIEKKDYNEMMLANNKKDELIDKVNHLKKITHLSNDEQVEIDNALIEISDIDKKNIAILENEKKLIKQELSKVSKNCKLLNAYTTQERDCSELLDVRE